MNAEQKRYEALPGQQTKPFSSVQGAFPEQWQAATYILQLMQQDYCQAKKQLEEIYRSFGERESWTSERLYDLLVEGNESDGAGNKGKVVSRKKGLSQNSQDSVAITSIRAYCLGSFEIYLNWKRVDIWHSLKAKSLLKYLVTRKGKPVIRDVLVETLWPNCDPEVGRNNLKAAVYSLRQSLLSKNQCPETPSPIVYSEGQYSINPKAEIWVDVDEFERHWLAGRGMEKKGESEEAAKEYRLAEELYRGDYFEDDPYTEWTLLPREALKDTYLAILGKLAYTAFETADYESCIVYSQKILRQDICHEEAYRWLIRCYSQLGQAHRARQWYSVCASTLKKELNTTPDKKTVDLYYRLRHRGVS
jgi:LuxR family maltose regulon positive regulatory protein